MSRAMLAAAALVMSAAVGAADPPKPAAPPAAPPAPVAAAPAAATPAPTAAATPAALAVVLKNVEAVHALVVPMKGSYMQHPDAFGRLFAQLQASGIAPVGPPFGRYLNDATQVPEADLQWEVGVPVGSEAKASPPLEVRDIPAGPAATLSYLGPPEGLAQGWQQIAQWIGANGYRPAGPALMVFDQPDPDDTHIELRMAVEKAQ
jgi:effector-binding domain-containing protein